MKEAEDLINFYTGQIEKLTKEKENIKKYIDKLFLDKSMAYARNINLPKSELQQILIGEMMCISEIKRFIEYIESE